MIGFIAKKLGLKGKETPDPSTWIGRKGKGKLVEPTDDLIDICEQCELMFDHFHGEGLRGCKKTLNTLVTSIVKKYPFFPIRIVKLFCKTKLILYK